MSYKKKELQKNLNLANPQIIHQKNIKKYPKSGDLSRSQATSNPKFPLLDFLENETKKQNAIQLINTIPENTQSIINAITSLLSEQITTTTYDIETINLPNGKPLKFDNNGKLENQTLKWYTITTTIPDLVQRVGKGESKDKKNYYTIIRNYLKELEKFYTFKISLNHLSEYAKYPNDPNLERIIQEERYLEIRNPLIRNLTTDSKQQISYITKEGKEIKQERQTEISFQIHPIISMHYQRKSKEGNKGISYYSNVRYSLEEEKEKWKRWQNRRRPPSSLNSLIALGESKRALQQHEEIKTIDNWFIYLSLTKQSRKNGFNKTYTSLISLLDSICESNKESPLHIIKSYEVTNHFQDQTTPKDTIKITFLKQ